MSVLPWPDLIAAAPLFGLTPPAFWALSVREWRALVGEGQRLDAGRLAELSAAFPDDEKPLALSSQEVQVQAAIFALPPYGGAVTK